jgi:hypothetical protein
MSHDPNNESKQLSCEELDAVAGGGNAIEQIQQIVNDTPKQPQNTMQVVNQKPPDMMYPTSAPYNF